MEEKLLVQKVLLGEKSALESFIKQYQRLVGHIVFRIVDGSHEREEVVQDVFLKAYDKLAEFNFQSKLSTWLATIAYRHAINFNKKNKKYNETTDLENANYVPTQAASYEQKDSNRFILEAVEKLPDPYKAILTLYHLEGFSYQEIVEVLDMPEGTVKNYLFRARKKLKDILTPYLKTETLLE